MEAQISPTFGLMLLETAEALTLVSMGVSMAAVVATAIVAVVIRSSNAKIHDTQTKQYAAYLTEQKRQTEIAEHQRKLDSAKLVVELDKQYMTKEFREVLRHMQEDEWGEDEYGDENGDPRRHLDRFINFTSKVCSFHADKVLTDNHMIWHFDGYLIDFNENKWVREYIKKEPTTWRFIHRRWKQVPNLTSLFSDTKTGP